MTTLNLSAIRQSLQQKDDQQLIDILYYSQDDYDQSVLPVINDLLIERGFTQQDIEKANESYIKLKGDIAANNNKVGKKASFFMRFLNYIIDHIICFYGVGYGAQYYFIKNGISADEGLYYAIGIIGTIIYYTITIGLFKATIGMLVTNLRILNVDNSKVDFVTGIKRGAFMILNFLILSIGHFWIFTEKKTTLVDRWSGTNVVYK